MTTPCMQHRPYPKVSVVTITLNNRDALRLTMASVLSQTYPDLEYIVVDGQSTDGSVALIEAHGDQVDRWVSEPDHGIYDALNKGIALSDGEWIIFMNAGDTFFEANTLRKIFDHTIARQSVFLYGHHHTRYQNYVIAKTAGSLQNFWKGPPFSHQATLVRRDFQQAHPYNVDNRIAADFELLFCAFQNGRPFQAIDVPIAIVSAGGLSDLERLKSTWAHYRIVRAFDRSARVHVHYLGAAAMCLFKDGIKAWMPRTWVDRIRQRRHSA